MALAVAGCGGTPPAPPRLKPVAHRTTTHGHLVGLTFSYPQFQTPLISGILSQGQVLSTTNGTWLNSPTNFSYQWQDCSSTDTSCANISGAIASTYTLQATDIGHEIDVIVTAANSSGSASSTSAPTTVVPPPPAPQNTVLPVVSGSNIQGHILNTTTGTWTNSPTSFTYQWQDCNSSGGSCANITGATTNAYTLQAGDVGDTVDVIVTATNSSGSTLATSVFVGPIASGSGSLSCNLNATTANYASQITAATPGQVVCLASGNYSSVFTGANKSSPGITITSAPGAAVTFNSGIDLYSGSGVMNDQANWTLDGTGGGGTMNVSGALDMETSGDASLNQALNITIQNVAFNAASPEVEFQGPLNSNVTFDRDTFVAGNIGCSGGSPSGLGGIFYDLSSGSTPSGLTVENSVFVSPMDLWNPDRAIQDTNPMVVENNVIAGFVDHTEANGCNHIDGFQWYNGTNGTIGDVTFTGNFCYDDYGCAMAFDGTSGNTLTDNACFDTETACFNMYSDQPGSTINHNSEQTGGADPGYCNTMDEPSAPIQACTYNQLIITTNKSGDRLSSGETLENSISPSSPNVGSATSTDTNNLYPGAGSPNIAGTPTFAGGSNPTTWAGFELGSSSTGFDAGSDGLSVGIRASAGGPPTGGGSAPVNTVTPSLTGVAVQGNTLTTTNGTWTITGGVPTVTTYQWFDCPTSTFVLASCPAIQPETAPTSANASTYTLQASDETDYVFAMVTVTNANGQVNAVTNAIGPVN